MLDGKRIARSLENTVDALIPTMQNEDAIKQLEEIREAAAKASYTLQRLYTRNAREAFGEIPRAAGPSDRDSSSRSRRGDDAVSGQASSDPEASRPDSDR